MSEPREILSEEEIGLVTALVGAVPAIGRWLGGLFEGNDVDPNASRRVADVLPPRGASDRAFEELEREQRGSQ